MINLQANNRAWFNGTFDGQGYTIKGLVVKTYGGWHKSCGMFAGVSDGATVRNFTLDGFYVCDPDTSGNEATVSYGYCGAAAVVGHAKHGATLDNITLKNGTVTSVANGYAGIGTMVGVYDGNGETTLAITNCTVEDTVTVVAGSGMTGFVGGMIGYFEDNNKSDFTVLDLSNSIIQPAGSDSSIAPFGRFKANGSTAFRWDIKNTAGLYNKRIYPDVNGADNASTINEHIVASGCYGASATKSIFNSSDSNPKISSREDLKAFLEYGSEFPGQTITLENDITLNADTTSSGWYDASGVVKVSPTATYFKGVFDGQGYTIKGLVVKASVSWAKEAGMFPGAMGATIQNFTLDGFYVCNTDTSGNDGTVSYGQCGTGAIVGHAKAGATIDNVTVKNGTVTCVANGYAGIGSVVGCYDGDAATLAITNCTVESTVNVVAGAGATTFVGGLIGYFQEGNKSDFTILDLSGSVICPAGSDSSIAPFGRFQATGGIAFRWDIKNDTTNYSRRIYPEVGGTDNASAINALIIASGSYGDSAVTIKIAGVQIRESDHSVRFVGLLHIPDEFTAVAGNYTDVKYLGFEVTVNDKTANLNSTKLYSAIQASGNPLPAPNGYYYFTFVVKNVRSEVTFDINPKVFHIACIKDHHLALTDRRFRKIHHWW